MVRKRGRDRLHRLDLHALAVFVAVFESGSMTAAARRLGLTQPAVSMAVRQLEADLDALLLDRSLRPLRPTHAGKVLHRHASRLLSESEKLLNDMALATDEALPSIRLGLVDSFAVTVGAPLISHLQGMAEELAVWSGLTGDLGRGLRDRELDLLITSDPMDDVADLDRHVVLREPFVIIAPAGKHLPDGAPALAALAGAWPLVRYSARSTIGATIERHLRHHRIEAPRRLEFDASETVVAMVTAGLGWAITTPLCLLQGRADFERLTVHPMPGRPLARELYLLARRGEMPEVLDRVRTLIAGLLDTTLRDACAARLPWLLEQVCTGARAEAPR